MMIPKNYISYLSDLTDPANFLIMKNQTSVYSKKIKCRNIYRC